MSSSRSRARCGFSLYNSQFRIRLGLAIDPITSNIYICENDSFHIKVFSYKFDLLFTFTNASLRKPYGICISHDGVFIIEEFSNVIHVLTLDGDIVSKYSYETLVRHLTAPPWGVAVDRDGDVYICVDWDRESKLFVLTHDEVRYYYFARSSLVCPRNVKFNQDNVIVLELPINRMVELKVYSRMEELLKVVRGPYLDDVHVFDVTPNSNYVIYSQHYTIIMSKDGKVLKTLRKYIYDPSITQYGMVLDTKTLEIVGSHLNVNEQFSFYRFPMKDSKYYYRRYWI